MGFIFDLQSAFQDNSHPENAVAMAKYMRNHFSFFGIKTTERRAIFKEIWEQNKLEVTENSRTIALELFAKEQREFHYCAIEILIKQLKKNYTKEDLHLIEKLITQNCWWDSVDTITKYILGQYLLEYPDQIDAAIGRFSNADHLWLNRSAILFQLGYKQKTDFELLKKVCIKYQSSSEFFIQKAMGWALREYAKTNPEAVREFVADSILKPLSTKEALKNI